MTSWFLACLALIFITLKLTGVITWSWWFVLMPLWAPVGMLLLFMFGMTLIAGLAAIAVAVIDR